MKILNSDTPKITLEMEDNETTVRSIGGKKVEIIIIKDGAKSIERGAFTYCPNLKEIYLPKSINYIGDSIFKSDYSVFIFLPLLQRPIVRCRKVPLIRNI